MRCITGYLIPLLLVAATAVPAQDTVPEPDRPEVGVVEKLEQQIPMDLVFHDSERNEVRIGDLIKKPTVLLLVYFRCPSICSPLMNELARAVDKIEGLEPGKDFDLITVSFDPREDQPESGNIAKNGKKALLARMEKKVPPESWHFLTGSEESTRALSDAVGFYYKLEDTGDYTHPAATIFLTSDGKIARYLQGVQLLPANVEMAIIDAKEGRARSFMQTVQKLCFAFDPEGQTYVLQVNRIILVVSLVILAVFMVFLFRRRRKREPAPKEGIA